MTGILLRRGLLWSILCGSSLQLGGAAWAATAAAKAHGQAPEPAYGRASVKELPPVTAEVRVLSMLHDLNQTEIRAGKLAEKQGDIKATRDFGATLVRDHQAADKKVVAFAKKKGIDLDKVPVSDPDQAARHRETLNRLGMLSGPNFDRAFAITMQDGHAAALDMVGKARVGVSDPGLRALLGDFQPTLNKHFDMAKKLAAKYAPTPTYSREPANVGSS